MRAATPRVHVEYDSALPASTSRCRRLPSCKTETETEGRKTGVGAIDDRGGRGHHCGGLCGTTAGAYRKRVTCACRDVALPNSERDS
eukprot:6204307-Pleurochrysis_carterae.AAC.2